MFRNKEVKNIFFIELIIASIGLLGIFFTNRFTYLTYKRELIENNAFLVNSLIEKHPELEDDIIKSLTNRDIKYNESIEILQKYGLDDLESLNYINKNDALKNKALKANLNYIILLIVIMIVTFDILLRNVYKKINTLSKYTNNILNGRYSMDIREYEEGDISNLKNDLYKMTIKLKEQNELSLKDKKYLEDTLSDISHQLKTPLTSMYVINELLYDDNINKDKKLELLSKNKSQLERIEWLVSSLLKMSRLDSGSEVLKQEDTKIINIINRAVEPIRIPLELKNINLQIDCDDEIMSNIDLNWTAEAFINILKNACEHTKDNGEISIKCSNNPIYVEVSISDNGCGIDDKDLPHIFERFYKGKSNKESIGIGLNMAKKIIDMQKGDIRVFSKVGQGTKFVVRFYKNVI